MSMLKHVLALSVLISAQGALACSCEEWSDARELLRQGHAVFIGIPTTNSKKLPMRPGESEPEQVTTMSIVRGFKNVTAKKLSLYTEVPNGGNCGLDFKSHRGTYLIVAYRDSAGRLQTDGCSLRSLSYDDRTLNRMVTQLNELRFR